MVYIAGRVLNDTRDIRPSMTSLKDPWGPPRYWDATCPDTFAPTHIDLAGREAGAVAKQAKGMKKAKYSELSTTHLFIPVAVETSGALGPEACNFLQELGQWIREDSGEPLISCIILQL